MRRTRLLALTKIYISRFNTSMRRQRKLSDSARLVLAAMLDRSGSWSHGYELSKETGVKSGTLYPLLMRLEQQGYLEAKWHPPTENGRPPRHAYRLTQTGLQLARQNRPESVKRPRLVRGRSTT